MVNTRQFSESTYMQDMTKSHTFSAKNQGSTYTPIRLIRREIRYAAEIRLVSGRLTLIIFESLHECCKLPETYIFFIYSIKNSGRRL